MFRSDGHPAGCRSKSWIECPAALSGRFGLRKRALVHDRNLYKIDRFGSKADMRASPRNVRFTPEAHMCSWPTCHWRASTRFTVTDAGVMFCRARTRANALTAPGSVEVYQIADAARRTSPLRTSLGFRYTKCVRSIFVMIAISLRRARASRDITVPIGIPVTSAISR